MTATTPAPAATTPIPSTTTTRIVSADAHILEPPGIWDTWLPERFRDRAPQLVKDAEGGDAWLFAGASDPDPIGLTATPGMAWDEFRWTGVTYDAARAGCYDGAARLADMDADGVWAEVLFAPQRTIGHFLGDADDEFVLAGVEAYNRFLTEQFCGPDPGRLVGTAQIPSTGIDDAVAGLQAAATRGFRAVTISNWPAGGEALSDADDTFWAAAQEAGLPVCIHINLISRETRQKARAAATRPTGRDIYGRGGRPNAKAKAVAGLSGVFSTVPNTIGQLIFTGVLERFHDLQVALIETGVGWIPHLLEQMDDRFWRNRAWGDIPLSEPPSFYWYRNFSATFIVDRNGIENRHAVGVDNMMWSTDYPHHGNDWPYSRKTIMDMMGHIDPAERARIVGGNAMRIFGLAP